MRPSYSAKRSGTRVIAMSDASIDRVYDWLAAIGDHAPGDVDAPLATISGWRRSDLQTLWINATVLLTLADDLRGHGLSLTIGGLTFGKQDSNRFTIKPEGQPETEIQYRPVQLRRLKLYACAAVGTTFCPETLKPGEPPVGLDRLSAQALVARKGGDVNFVLRRGAMLHTDIAMSGEPEQPIERASSSPAPRQMRLNILDGGAAGDVEIPIHWIIARLLLDDVIPAGEKKAAPGRDALVRDWYRATAAWMQDRERHDIPHLDRARALFPRDDYILFLSGCQREAFAAPRLHAAMDGAAIPPGFILGIGSDRAELHRAEEYFRRALDVDPDLAEARLHLGHVLLAGKKYKDAADALRRIRFAHDDQLEYYRAIFLGAAEAGLARDAEARTEYRRAAELRPEAQSPLLALSELALKHGDRQSATRELARVFALPPYAPERDDPWWEYFTSQVRDADARIASLRADVAAVASEGRPR
jgi:tetratricopeptide (TPR) repeat protein